MLVPGGFGSRGFEGKIQAVNYARINKLPFFGICLGMQMVPVLNGAPGIYSARYAGENSTDEDNCMKLLSEMNGIQNREAKFVCALALVYPDGRKEVFEGECLGLITEEKRGTNGFGYDPVFYISRYDKTMAEIDTETKNMISHRSNAVEKLINYLEK